MTKLKSMIAISLIALGYMISQSALASSSDEFTDEQATRNYQLNLGGLGSLESLVEFAETCSMNQVKNNDEPQEELESSDQSNPGSFDSETLNDISTLHYFFSGDLSRSQQSRFSVDDSRIRFEIPGRVNDENNAFGRERRQTAKNRSRNGFVTGIGVDFTAYSDPFDTTGSPWIYR